MKQSARLFNLKRLPAVILFCLFQTILWAQDSTSSSSTRTTTTTTTTTWYTQPWIWVVGGALFVLILFGLTRGNSSSTTEKTTVIKDREI